MKNIETDWVLVSKPISETVDFVLMESDSVENIKEIPDRISFFASLEWLGVSNKKNFSKKMRRQFLLDFPRCCVLINNKRQKTPEKLLRFVSESSWCELFFLTQAVMASPYFLAQKLYRNLMLVSCCDPLRFQLCPETSSLKVRKFFRAIYISSNGDDVTKGYLKIEVEVQKDSVEVTIDSI